MPSCRRSAAVLVAAVLSLGGCTAQQWRDFQERFGTPAPEAETPVEQQAATLGQCAPEPQVKTATPPTFTPAQRALTMGVWMYEDGDYVGAESYLKTALSLDTADLERVRAHKYLAFIMCAERRDQECRREFREALALDPKFDLTPAEQGHPRWGPVFRSLKPAASTGK